MNPPRSRKSHDLPIRRPLRARIKEIASNPRHAWKTWRQRKHMRTFNIYRTAAIDMGLDHFTADQWADIALGIGHSALNVSLPSKRSVHHILRPIVEIIRERLTLKEKWVALEYRRVRLKRRMNQYENNNRDPPRALERELDAVAEQMDKIEEKVDELAERMSAEKKKYVAIEVGPTDMRKGKRKD